MDNSIKLCKDVMHDGEKEAQGYEFLEDDKVCVLYSDGSVYIKNLKTGKAEKDFGDDFTTIHVLGDTIYSTNKMHNKIVEIDCKTGQKGAEYKYDLTNQGIAFCKDKEENVYACTEKGIFLLGNNNEMTEVVPGNIMSEGAISTSSHIDGVSIEDEVFYVTYLISGNNSREYRMVSYSKK